MSVNRRAARNLIPFVWYDGYLMCLFCREETCVCTKYDREKQYTYLKNFVNGNDSAYDGTEYFEWSDDESIKSDDLHDANDDECPCDKCNKNE